jgi:hypothetical protein
MKTLYPLYFCFVFSFVIPAQGKPLSYVGGTMVMQENDETGYTVTVDYTFHPHFALGVYAKEDIGGNDFFTIGPQLNTLIKRWNLPDGQGNIFSMTGVGVSRQGSNTQPAGWGSLYSGDIEKSFWQRGCAGFAPYLANYDQLNTWLLIRMDHHPAKEDHFVVTPVVRFFYKTIWLEVGYSNNNHVMVNWTVQF